MNVVVSIDKNRTLEASTLTNDKLVNYIHKFVDLHNNKSLFVNGKCVIKGHLTNKEIKNWKTKLKGVDKC